MHQPHDRILSATKGSALVSTTPHASWAAVYDSAYQHSFGAQYERFTSLTLKFLSEKVRPLAKVVDFGAGTGRLSIPLARGGLTVVAVDPCREMLDQLTLKANGIPVTVCHSKMEDYKGQEDCDWALCVFTVLAYLLDDDSLRKSLQAAHDALKPGGFLLLDVPLRGVFSNHQKNASGMNRRVTVTSEANDIFRYREELAITLPDGRQDSYRDEFEIRYWDPKQVLGVMEKIGFVFIENCSQHFPGTGAQYYLMQKPAKSGTPGERKDAPPNEPVADAPAQGAPPGGGVIGIVASHREQVIPTNPEYELFFSVLRAEGRRTEVVDDPLTAETLARYDSLLIGEPHTVISEAEISGIQRWVNSGGHLMVLSSLGGDAAPGGKRSSRSNLGELTGFMSFEDNCLGMDEGVNRVGTDEGISPRHLFNTRVTVDVSALTLQPDLICYHAGCSISTGRLDRPGILLRAPDRAFQLHGVRLRETRSDAHDPYPRQAGGALLVRQGCGLGSILALGSSWTFKNDTIIREQNLAFASWIFLRWLPLLSASEVSRRQRRPQRHRLLHGYPMAPAMLTATPGTDLESTIEVSLSRKLIVGVLPHPFCNPRVKGCGFCTFPHEVYAAPLAEETTRRVAEEVRRFAEVRPEFKGRKISSLYFGGGTANLGRPEPFRMLCRSLGEAFDFRGTEITLEGVPAYHDLEPGRRLSDIISESFDGIRLRISMGIQTLDPDQLRRMGRSSFGDLQTVQNIIRRSREGAGYSVSADILINLPGQSLEQMRTDVRKLVDSGIDHICLYHLVLFEGLGTEWSRDPAMLQSLPNHTEAFRNWMDLSNLLRSEGFRQQTLTNFERIGAAHPFDYEMMGFEPETYDWLGFGPGAISFFSNEKFDNALKVMNTAHSKDYNTAITNNRAHRDRWFLYNRHDLKILYITRRIALLEIPFYGPHGYKNLFGSDILKDFPHEIEALKKADLIRIRYDCVRLTGLGKFYADTVAGMFAWRQIARRQHEALVTGRHALPEAHYDRTHPNDSLRTPMS